MRLRCARNSHPRSGGQPKTEGLAELRRHVGDAFNRVPRLLGGSNEPDKGEPDAVSRAKTVNAVLDFAEASHGFPVARHEGSLIMGAAIRLREALTRLSKFIFRKWTTLHVHARIYIVVASCISLSILRGVRVNEKSTHTYCTVYQSLTCFGPLSYASITRNSLEDCTT